MSEEQKIINTICKNCFENKNCYYRFFNLELECITLQQKLSEYDEYQVKIEGKLFREEVRV